MSQKDKEPQQDDGHPAALDERKKKVAAAILKLLDNIQTPLTDAQRLSLPPPLLSGKGTEQRSNALGVRVESQTLHRTL